MVAGRVPDARRGEKGGAVTGVGRAAAAAAPVVHLRRSIASAGVTLYPHLYGSTRHGAGAGRKGGPASGTRRGERGVPAAGAAREPAREGRRQTKREDAVGMRVDFAKLRGLFCKMTVICTIQTVHGATRRWRRAALTWPRW